MQVCVYEPYCHSAALTQDLSHSLQSHYVQKWSSLLACSSCKLAKEKKCHNETLFFVNSCDNEWGLWVFVSPKQKWETPAQCCIIRLLAP